MKRLRNGLVKARTTPRLLSIEGGVNGRAPCDRSLLSLKLSFGQQIRCASSQGVRPRTALFFPGKHFDS